jgi:hypothetical protein
MFRASRFDQPSEEETNQARLRDHGPSRYDHCQAFELTRQAISHHMLRLLARGNPEAKSHATLQESLRRISAN